MKIKEHQESLVLPEEVINVLKNYFKKEREGDLKARSCAIKDLKKFLIETKDGSFTLSSAKLNGRSETMHTHHGAIEESFKKFVEPANLAGKFADKEKSEVRILDICSGLGYNAAAALHQWRHAERNIRSKIRVDMVEISIETLAAALLIPSPLEEHDIIKHTIENKLFNEGYLSFKPEEKKISKELDINVYCMDARILVKNLIESGDFKNITLKSSFPKELDRKNDSEKEHQKKGVVESLGIYDAIFLDPFSPPMAPELYTPDFFKALNQVIKKNGLLLTYTSAAPVRSALIQAGFYVGEVPPFGRKKGGTIASISPDIIPHDLPLEDELMIALSDAGIPYRDQYLSDSIRHIKERRVKERKIMRGKDKFTSTVKTPIYLLRAPEDHKLKRRVLRNLQTMGFEDFNLDKSRFIVCPQFNDCICGRGCKKFKNSKERIEEMGYRLQLVKK